MRKVNRRLALNAFIVGAACLISIQVFSSLLPIHDKKTSVLGIQSMAFVPTPTPTPTPTLTPTPTPTMTPTPTPTPTLTPTPTDTPTPMPTADPTNDTVWDRLAECESHRNWADDTGNNYFGGLQFSQSAWESVDGVGKPSNASREEQIAKGKILQSRRGWSPWGGCSKALGLN